MAERITLEAALRDLRAAEPRVRAAAAEALASLREATPAERRTTEDALVRATRDDDAKVRYNALCTLIDLEMRDASRRFLELLDDEDSFVAQAAAAALGELEIALGFEPLRRLLETGSAHMRFQATLSLGQIDARRAAPFLVKALGDLDLEVRTNAAAAVGDCAAAGVLDDALRAAAAERLVEMITTAPKDARLEAALALARLGDRRATAPLCEALGDTARGLVAADALGKLGDPAAVTALRRVRGRFWNPRVLRVAASAALARLGGGEEERTFLLERARRGPSDARGLAIQALGALGGDGARTVLEEVLARRRDEQAAAAAAALGALGDPAARGALERAAAAHADAEVRAEAAAALERLEHLR